MAIAALGAACVTFTGPTSALHPLPRDSTPVWRACARPYDCPREARLVYLGTGGFLLTTGGEALMTAPSFSHPGLLAVVTPFWPVRSDSAAVDRELHRLLGADAASLADVRIILVGHGHYEHLMDVPLIARRYSPRATVYGSLTTKRILMGDSALRTHPARVDSLEPESVGTASHVGHWIYSPSQRIRFMALKSRHPPNWWFITFAACQPERDRASLPRTARGWCEGEPLSYLIDLLDDGGRPLLRIFYQDAAAGLSDVAIPPFDGGDRREVDILVVCAGNFDKPADYPGSLVRALHPRHILVAHWEDFFHDQGNVPTPIRRMNTTELAARLDRAAPQRWITLVPGGRVTVRY